MRNPPRTRDDVYNLLRQSVWNRGPNTGTESGHTWIYRPFGAIARRVGANRDVLEAMRDEFLELYGISGPASVMPEQETDAEGCVAILDGLFDATPGANTLVSEGYAMNSQGEGAELDYRLVRDTLRRGGTHTNQAVYAGGIVCDTWNNKATFRARTIGIHGEHSVPMGTSFEQPNIEKVKAWLSSVFDGGDEKAVLKIIGAAGMGNLIVSRDEMDDAAIANIISRANGSWMIGEAWRPWEKSFCVSFFAPDDTATPVHMTVCGQVLTKSGGFIGGKSFDTLAKRDQAALGAICSPIAIAMRDDGMRGFMGFDVILCEPRKGDRNILPDCGLAVVFIETNARLNGHNQEMLGLDLLARRDSVDRETLIHMRVRNRPVTGAVDRAASKRLFAERLEGIAKPLTTRKMVEGEAYFFLDVNCGSTPSAHDAVMFVGTEESAPRIMTAFEKLQGEGLLLA